MSRRLKVAEFAQNVSGGRSNSDRLPEKRTSSAGCSCGVGNFGKAVRYSAEADMLMESMSPVHACTWQRRGRDSMGHTRCAPPREAFNSQRVFFSAAAADSATVTGMGSRSTIS